MNWRNFCNYIFVPVFLINSLSFVTANGSNNYGLVQSNDLPPSHLPQIIPKIFHHIWINFGKGDTVFPKYQNNFNRLKELHPGWEFRLWRENEIVDLIKTHMPEFLQTFLSYDLPIKKHDSARAVILHVHGGVYVDHDFIALKNIEPLLKSYNFVAGSELYNGFVPVNGFMAATKGNLLMKNLVQAMNAPGVAKQFVLNSTGPAILKKTMIEYARVHGPQGIKVYSHEFFYPIYWSNKNSLRGKNVNDLSKLYPYSYLIQEYDAVWQN